MAVKVTDETLVFGAQLHLNHCITLLPDKNIAYIIKFDSPVPVGSQQYMKKSWI